MPVQKIMFADGHWIHAQGSEAVVEEEDGTLYLGLALRNAGAGIAVLQGWHPWTEVVRSDVGHRPAEEFRRQIRDIYVAPGDVGMWQGALHEADGDLTAELRAARSERRRLAVDLLYSDHVPLAPGSRDGGRHVHARVEARTRPAHRTARKLRRVLLRMKTTPVRRARVVRPRRPG